MFRRAGRIGIVLALAGCTDQVVLRDLPGAGASDATVGSRDAGPWTDPYCGSLKNTVPMTYNPQPDDILILLDRSASMQAYFGGQTRESAAQGALAYAIGLYQMRIKFGFEEFPSDPAKYQCPQGSCCAAPVSVDPLPNNYLDMNAGIQCSDSHGSVCPVTSTDSPSHAALAQVRDYYKAKDKLSSPTNARYVLLVTSSDPSCAGDSRDSCSQARSAASTLGEAGVRIVVLNLGSQPDQNACLSQISQKGSSVPPPDNTKSLYPAYNTYDLGGALSEFFSAVAKASCTMISGYAPPSTNPAQLTVSIDKHQIQPVDGNGRDGWSFDDPAGTSITFSGSACEEWVKSQKKTPYVVYSSSPSGCSPYP